MDGGGFGAGMTHERRDPSLDGDLLGVGAELVPAGIEGVVLLASTEGGSAGVAHQMAAIVVHAVEQAVSGEIGA